MIPFVVAGLVTGSIYAIAAMGLVVTYRTTGLFNFAHGAIGMGVAYAFYQFREEWGLPTWLSLVLSLVVVAPLIGFAVDRLLFRGLGEVSQASRVVVTIGLLLLLQGLAEAIFGAFPRFLDPFLPTSTFSLAGANVGYDQLGVFVIALVVLVGLEGFFRANRLGVAMRAVVDDRTLVATAGFSPDRISGFTWALGCGLAGLAGVLLSPVVGLDSVVLTLLVVQAFAAAAVGRLVSLPITFVAALGLGVASSLTLKVLGGFPDLVNGLRPSLPFLFLFGVLVFSRRGTFRELGVGRPWQGVVTGRDVPITPVVAVAVVLALILPGPRVFLFGLAIVTALLYLSITALTGTSGLISLCQAGFAGTGAFAYIHLVGRGGLPEPVALVVATLLVIPLGALIALPALRLPSLFLALATFGFGLLIDGLLFTSWIWFSGGQGGLRLERPSLLQNNRATVLVLIAALAAAMYGIQALRRSMLGRTLVAMRDSEAATVSTGINLLWPKLAVFSISAAMAAMAGCFYVLLLESAGRSFFQTLTGVGWVAIVVIGGVQSIGGALVAALVGIYIPNLVAGNPDLASLVNPLFGLGAILLARQPGGLVELFRRIPRRLVVVSRAPRAAAATANKRREAREAREVVHV